MFHTMDHGYKPRVIYKIGYIYNMANSIQYLVTTSNNSIFSNNIYHTYLIS